MSEIERWNDMLVADGKEPFRQDRLYDPHGVPDETIGFVVDRTVVGPRVLAALREHRTQSSTFEERTEDQQRAALSIERGVIAWPPCRRVMRSSPTCSRGSRHPTALTCQAAISWRLAQARSSS